MKFGCPEIDFVFWYVITHCLMANGLRCDNCLRGINKSEVYMRVVFVFMCDELEKTWCLSLVCFAWFYL